MLRSRLAPDTTNEQRLIQPEHEAFKHVELEIQSKVFANHEILANGSRFIFLELEAFKWADGHFVVVLPPPWPAAQQPRRGHDGCRCS